MAGSTVRSSRSSVDSVDQIRLDPDGGDGLSNLYPQVSFEAMQGQYWRLISPAFLHFGWLHIAFNSLWMWELGGRVERVMGHFNMLGLFLVIALVSNASQVAAISLVWPGLPNGIYGTRSARTQI